MFCYHWDSLSGTYAFASFRVMQAGSIATAVLLAALVGGLKLKEHRRRIGRRSEGSALNTESDERPGDARGREDVARAPRGAPFAISGRQP
jgi:hypothetical protein